jgi:hypothetical protein
MLCGRFTFPGRWPSGRSKQHPRLQWRDRAGFAPDFPVMPLVGTQTRLALYHDRIHADNSRAHVRACLTNSWETLQYLLADARWKPQEKDQTERDAQPAMHDNQQSFEHGRNSLRSSGAGLAH